MSPATPSQSNTSGHDDCDVLVMGGGHAGSTMAMLTARQARHVVLLDKAQHPRCHIGESPLPAGDSFSSTPSRPSLVSFKLPHHAQLLRHWRITWAAWRARRHNLRSVPVSHQDSVVLEP